MMLKSINIKQMERFASHTNLDFDKGMTVLLGQNASGKTSILEIIRKAVSFDFSTLSREAFELSYEMEPSEDVYFSSKRRGEPTKGAVRVTVSNKRVEDNRKEPKIPGFKRGSVDPGLSAEASISIRPEGMPEVVVSRDRKGFTVSMDDAVVSKEKKISGKMDPLTVLGPDNLAFEMIFAISQFGKAGWRRLSKSGKPSSRRDEPGDEEGWYPYAEVLLGCVENGAVRFDEALDIYRGIFEDFEVHGLSGNQIHGIERSKGLVPTEIREFFSNLQDDRNASRVVLTEKNSTLLKAIMWHLECERVELSFERDTATSDEWGESYVYRFPVLRIWRKGGTTVIHKDFSFGQKRIVAFLWYLASQGHSVIADELVNGFHHAWIKSCVDRVAKRQSFFSSQNPLLLDFLSFESCSEVQSTFILTESMATGKLFARNLSSSEAQSFYKSYEAGVLHVSEILKERGLW